MPAAERQPSIDALRGLVMIIMALDHVRDFFHRQAMLFQPMDMAHTTPAIFFTRWITHFCAPTFAATAGVAAYLWLQRGHSKAELSHFLWTRGLWLVLLDLTIVRLAMFFSLTSGPVFLLVFWVLGGSMVVLSLLIYLPMRVLAILSIAVIVLHNLADSIQAQQFGSSAWIWNLLHQSGAFPVGKALVIVGYPLVPWFAVMSAGFCFGRVMTLDPAVRRRIMWHWGLAMSVAFVILRGANRYGDPERWTTPLSFLKCNKYPPSLDFLLMTLGPALLILALFEKFPFARLKPLIIFGRTPLFFFVVHFFVIHLLEIPLAAFQYGRVGFLINPLPTMGGDLKLYPGGFGYSLAGIYLIWALVTGTMYPLCKWFARVKQQKGLRYL